MKTSSDTNSFPFCKTVEQKMALVQMNSFLIENKITEECEPTSAAKQFLRK